MQDPVVFIEPMELYNLLNQVYLGAPCLVREYFLLLFDIRKAAEFSESHIITSYHIPYKENEGYILPQNIDYTAVEHIVVVDNRTSSLKEISSSGVACAKLLYNKMGSKYSVNVLHGGFELFSELYPFLRSNKILFTQNEKYLIKMYPVEIDDRFLYTGTYEQAGDPLVGKHLKIKAHINATTKNEPRFTNPQMISGENGEMVPQLLNIPIEDDINADIFQYFPVVCSFIEQHLKKDGKTLLIYSDLGISRCVVLVMAYFINKHKKPLKDVLGHVIKCNPSICPNRSFIKSLIQWEIQILGEHLTKADELHFLSYE